MEKEITREEKIELLMSDLENLTKSEIKDEKDKDKVKGYVDVGFIYEQRNHQVDLSCIDYCRALDSLLKDDPNYEFQLDIKEGKLTIETSRKYIIVVLRLLGWIFDVDDEWYLYVFSFEDPDKSIKCYVV